VCCVNISVVSPSSSVYCYRHTIIHHAKNHSKDITCVAYSLSARLVASGSCDCTGKDEFACYAHKPTSNVAVQPIVLIYEPNLGHPIGRCLGQDGPISALLFADPHPLLFVADQSGMIALWLVKGIKSRLRIRNSSIQLTGVNYGLMTSRQTGAADALDESYRQRRCRARNGTQAGAKARVTNRCELT